MIKWKINVHVLETVDRTEDEGKKDLNQCTLLEVEVDQDKKRYGALKTTT